jgi:hypothetical protein
MIKKYFNNSNKNYTPLFIVNILMIIICISIVIYGSFHHKGNAHPDERMHQHAIEYHSNHLLPLDVNTDNFDHSFSSYGHSRLYSQNLGYILPGILFNLINFITIPNYIKARLSSIITIALVFFLIFFFLSKNVERIGFFFLTPQVFYIFSYPNDDWIGAILGLFIASSLLIKSDTKKHNLYLFISQLFLLGLALISKKNFLPMTGYFLVFTFLKQVKLNLIPVKKIIILSLIIFIPLTIHKISMIYVNGFNYAEKVASKKETMAQFKFKSNTQIEKQFPWLNLKRRGVTLKEMLVKHNWARITAASSFLLFGWMNVRGPNFLYKYFTFLIIILFSLMIFLAIRSKTGRLELFFSLGVLASLICASLWHSWTNDFQAQGRYLLPFLPTLYYSACRLKHYSISIIGTILILIHGSLFINYFFW